VSISSAAAEGEVLGLGRSLDAPGFLAAVIGLDAQLRIDACLQNAGLGLPFVIAGALDQFLAAPVCPALVIHVAPMARVALLLPIMGGGSGVQVTELFEDGQVGQRLG